MLLPWQDPARGLAGPRWHGPRADVAAVIALLDEPGTRQQALELVGGPARGR
jgi:hypothetical protein